MNWAEKKDRVILGEPLQKSGYSLPLVKLISCRPKKLNMKKFSVGEPLEDFQLLSSVAPTLLDCLGRPRSAFKKKRARWGNPLQNSGCFASVSGTDTTLTKEI